ncbi:MAG TPA: DUF2917 domain-containing protein [Burkholderiales bacterium]
MILKLKRNDFLRLRGARGVAIEVLQGRVWITEDGRAGDSFLGPGRRYRIGGEGLVLIGAETYANGDADRGGAELRIVSAAARQPEPHADLQPLDGFLDRAAQRQA